MSKRFAGVYGIAHCQKSTHEVIVFEVGLTPVKTNKENISTLQLLEGKTLLLLGMLVLFPAEKTARKHQENTFGDACAREI